jgi:FdhD protein
MTHSTVNDAIEEDPATVEILRFTGTDSIPQSDTLAVEEPLEIRVRGRAISVTMRTPGHDPELAAGFLLTEGLVRRPADILKIEVCPRNESGNLINVLLAPDVPVDFEKLTRHVFASSSCGLCGKATIDAVNTTFPPLPENDDVRVPVGTLYRLPDLMRAAQDTFSRTGGLHAAALFTTAGDLLTLREDVGRHNAVDKVLGHALLSDGFKSRPTAAKPTDLSVGSGISKPPVNAPLALSEHILLVSGRSSFEIIQKSLAARLPIVAAVSAPSSLAVHFARQTNQTLIGFLRGRRMNVYSHPHRISS